MPLWKRKTAPKSRMIQRKRLARRPMRRVGRTLKQPVQFFKRTQYLSGFLSNSTANDVFGAMVFTLSSIPNVTDFTHLYDQYKINGVKVSFIPRGTNSDIGNPISSPGYTGQSVGVFSALDYDDNNSPTSIQQLCEYQNMKMTRSHQVHTRYLKPRLLATGPLNSTGTTANTMVRKPTWIDCTDTLVPHFGVKYCLQQAPNVAQQFDVKVDYYLAFKAVR